MQSVRFDHNGMELKMNNSRKTGKLTNMWETTNGLEKKSEKEIRKYLEMNETKI